MLFGGSVDQPFGHTSHRALPPVGNATQTAFMAPKKQLDIGRVDKLIDGLWDLGATDLILTAGAPPLMRLDGELKPFNDEAVLDPGDAEEMLAVILASQNREPFRDGDQELDFSFTWRDKARIRGNAY